MRSRERRVATSIGVLVASAIVTQAACHAIPTTPTAVPGADPSLGRR